jgi:hypothetical protein
MEHLQQQCVHSGGQQGRHKVMLLLLLLVARQDDSTGRSAVFMWAANRGNTAAWATFQGWYACRVLAWYCPALLLLQGSKRGSYHIAALACYCQRQYNASSHCQ